MNYKMIFTFMLSLIIILSIAHAQKEIERHVHNIPVDQKHVRSLVIDANKIKTILYNTGSISNPGVQGNVLDFVWNGLGYAYEIGFLAGAKVPSALLASDSIRFIVDGFGSSSRSTADGDFAPDGITKWGWLPSARHQNPAATGIANNQDPASWPSSWSSWNGKYGSAIADMELLYEMNDSTDAEFPYYPFPLDTMRRGLGLSVTARYYQFAHPNLEDVLFSFFEVQNVSSKPLTKMVAGIMGDPHIGGPNNFADDAQNFNAQYQMIYSWDPDNLSDIPILPPGYFGITMVATPAHKGVTSYGALPFGGTFRPKNDSLVYDRLSEGSKHNELFYATDPNNLGDYILMLGSGFYSLAPGQKEEIGIAYLLAQDLAGLIDRAVVVEQENRFRFGAPGNPIALTSPLPGQKVQTNSIEIHWTDASMNNDTTIDLYYSNSPDDRWIPIGKNVPNTGTYQWDLTTLPEGVFYKIHMIKDLNGMISYDSTGGYFTINKPGDTAPQLGLLKPKNIRVIANTIPVQWLAGDADEDPVTIKIRYSDNNGFTYTLLDEVPNSGMYMFNTKLVPNTPFGKLQLEAVANGKSAVVESQSFRIGNFFTAVTDTASLKHRSGTGTGDIFPGIVDSAAVTGHSYRVTFDSLSGSLRYSLKDITTGEMKLQNELMTVNNGTGTLVDGMRIWFHNHTTRPDSGRSAFLLPPINVTRTVLPNFSSFQRKPLPVDLVFQFGSMDTNSSGNYAAPLDSFLSTSGSVFVKTPFTIVNMTDTTRLNVRIVEKASNIYTKRKTGRWDFLEDILLFNPALTNTLHADVIFSKTNELLPAKFSGGETFYLYTNKSFSKSDVFEFTADIQYGKPTSVTPDGTLPTEFVLEQNYPNPFNPETIIRFTLARRGRTSLTIYDAIGREIKRLMDEEMTEGMYSVEWDGKNQFGQPAASGVYFYRLQSGSFASTKKMVLMR
jgi:hypothetical protein